MASLYCYLAPFWDLILTYTTSFAILAKDDKEVAVTETARDSRGWHTWIGQNVFC